MASVKEKITPLCLKVAVIQNAVVVQNGINTSLFLLPSPFVFPPHPFFCLLGPASVQLYP